MTSTWSLILQETVNFTAKYSPEILQKLHTTSIYILVIFVHYKKKTKG